MSRNGEKEHTDVCILFNFLVIHLFTKVYFECDLIKYFEWQLKTFRKVVSLNLSIQSNLSGLEDFLACLQLVSFNLLT